jgi:hypothetical protein
MTPAERDRRFRKERARVLKEQAAREKDTARLVRDTLKAAKRSIVQDLAATSSEFQAFQLPRLQKSIENALRELGDDLAEVGQNAAGMSWTAGVSMIDEPLAAGGLRIAAVLPEVDTRQLLAIRGFLTDRLRDVPAEVARRINAEIALTMIGARTPGQAVSAVEAIVEGGRGRATTIVRTEMGRAFSMATQERQAQAAEVLPQLKKQWRRSGKLHSRKSHDLADGQIVPVDEPFIVGGVKLMFPRDPAAPAAETINCGCTSIPIMDSWTVSQPGRQPFSDTELTRNPFKRDLAAALEDG